MMWIEPCTEADYRIVSGAVGSSDITVSSEDLDRLVLKKGFTLVDDHAVLACGGVTSNWSDRAPNQVGTAWLMISEEVRYAGAGSSRMVRLITHQLYDLIIDYGYNLVEANANRHDLQAQKFVEHMGFRFCGLREHFGPTGEDFILYGLRGDYDRIRNRRRRRGCSRGTHQRPVGFTVGESAIGASSL